MHRLFLYGSIPLALSILFMTGLAAHPRAASPARGALPGSARVVAASPAPAGTPDRAPGRDTKTEYHPAQHFLATYHGDPQVVHASVISFGGTVDFIWPGIHVARISGISDRQAERLEHIPGVDRVLRDVSIRWVHGIDTDVQLRLQADADAYRRLSDDRPAQFEERQWALQRIGAREAWKRTRGSSAVRIGVLDTGISPDHIDLAGMYDLSLSRNMSASNPADDRDYIDRHHHGTHVSAIIASNGIGVAGVAPSSTLVGVKVLDDNGVAAFANIIAGIMYAVDDARVHIINLSLGGNAPGQHVRELGSILQRAVNYAEEMGVLVVASAGNEGLDITVDPLLACMTSEQPGALLVSATTVVGSEEHLACYSNFGRELISVAAPGGSTECEGRAADGEDAAILSALAPAVARRLGLDRPEAWYIYSAGTSMAAPHVTGVAALIKSRSAKASPAHIALQLAATADDLGATGRDAQFGNGRVNAASAVR